MKTTVKWVLVMLAAALLCVGGIIGANAAADITDQFTDENFKAAVYEAIEKEAPEPILDTDVAEVVSLYVGYRNIESLNGLVHFTSLKGLYCYSNKLTALPALPSSLEALNCEDNLLTALPSLPSGLKYLTCSLNKLTALPALPDGLLSLNCSNSEEGKGDFFSVPDPENYNQFASLPTMPASLESLNVNNLQFASLPALPASLQLLYCESNKLTALPALPAGLQYLYCQNNKLTGLNVTGLSLERLNCSYNDIPYKSAVVGFTGTWNGTTFIFDPQNFIPPPADKSTLTAKLIQAKAIAKASYSDASWDALQTAIAAAQAVADKAGATQAELDAQVTALNSAIAALQRDPSLPPPPFWENWPYRVVLILRYMLWGWIWMGWF